MQRLESCLVPDHVPGPLLHDAHGEGNRADIRRRRRQLAARYVAEDRSYQVFGLISKDAQTCVRVRVQIAKVVPGQPFGQFPTGSGDHDWPRNRNSHDKEDSYDTGDVGDRTAMWRQVMWRSTAMVV
jgi:hypothetical protein